MPVFIDSFEKILQKKGLQANGPVQKALTHACRIEMDEFVPYDEGNLSTILYEGPDYIIYESPYASYQYFGVRKDGTHQINEANRNREFHPLATSYWDKAMWTAKKDQIMGILREELKRHGGK